jgi:hypothetical protein
MNRDERYCVTRELPKDNTYSSIKQPDKCSYQERRPRSPPIQPVYEMAHERGVVRHAKSSFSTKYNDHGKPPRPGSSRLDHHINTSDHSRSTTGSGSCVTEATHTSSTSSIALESCAADRHMARGRPSQSSQKRDNRKSMPPRNEDDCGLHDLSEDSGFRRGHAAEQKPTNQRSHSSSGGTRQRERSGSFVGDLGGVHHRNSRVNAQRPSSSSDSHLDSSGVYGYKKQATSCPEKEWRHSSMSGIDCSAAKDQATHTNVSQRDQGMVDHPIVEESDDDDSNTRLFLFKLSKQLQDFAGPEQITSRYLAELSEKLGMPVAYSCDQGLELVTRDGIVLVSDLLKPKTSK